MRRLGMAPAFINSLTGKLVEPADPLGMAARRLQARGALTVAGLPCQPETGTRAQYGLKPQGGVLGQRYFSLDQPVDVLGTVAQSLGELGLRPAPFLDQVGDGVTGRRGPVRRERSTLLSHDSLL